MVYCTRCGTLNADNATVCTNCGSPLQTAQAQAQPGPSRPYARHWQWEDWEARHEYHRRSGAFAALVAGTAIILLGLSAFLAEVYNVNIPWGALIIIVIGIVIIVTGVRARNRWRHWQQQP